MTFTNNIAKFYGGGLNVEHVKNITLDSIVFINNTGIEHGGGFRFTLADYLLVKNSLFFKNKSGRGGGFHF